MSKTSNVTITISGSGDGMTLAVTTPTRTNTSSPLEHQPVTLSSGDNTIAVPTGARGVLILPAATSTVVKKLKQVGGDTGIAIDSAYATFRALPSGETTMIINAAAGETLDLYWT